MTRRWLALLLSGCAGLGLAALPALATDQTVHAKDDLTFAPETVTVSPGDTVTWVNDGGVHNVHFDGEPQGTPATAQKSWSEPVTRTFQTEGTYRYYCDPHVGAGMVGYVVVKGPSTTATATTETTAAPASTTEEPSSSPSPTPTPSPTEPPSPRTVLQAAAKGSSFCARRSKICRRPGVRLRLNVDPAGTVALLKGNLHRRAPSATRFTRFGGVSFALKQGTHDVSFRRTADGKPLRPGRYRLTLSETFMDRSVTIGFKIRSS